MLGGCTGEKNPTSVRACRYAASVDDLDLLIDLHVRNDRQGPGSDEETRRAIGLCRLDSSRPLDIADFGCGTGASTLVLARELPGRVTALDAAAPFIDRLRERAGASGLADRIDARVAPMESPPFEDGSFDLLWSEAAIYNIGFGAGARAWRRLLRPGGVLAVTELTWTTPERPAEIEQHWAGEYPGIATLPANLRTLEDAGYRPLAAFFLPASCWQDHYYGPLEASFERFLARHPQREACRRLIHAEQHEMRLFDRWGAWYGYAFYIAQAPSA
jgi:SAM-dependent methyltransferase